MSKKIIDIDGAQVLLVEVASNDGGKLYKMAGDDRICGAPIREVQKRFPYYHINNWDAALCDFLFEENGTLVLYNPDGTLADPFEMTGDNEINNID